MPLSAQRTKQETCLIIHVCEQKEKKAGIKYRGNYNGFRKTWNASFCGLSTVNRY
jgi:hypothetical protein